MNAFHRQLPDYASTSTFSPPPYKAEADHLVRGRTFTLSLGPRKWSTLIPAYGKHAHVRGTVTVSPGIGGHMMVELVATMSTMSHTRSQQQDLLRLTQFLPVPDAGGPVHFSFRLPPETTSTLPPSYARLTDGLAIDVRYSVVAISRPPLFSLRKRERLESDILYLPKSVVPVPPSPPAPLNDTDTSSWRRITLEAPQCPGAVLLIPDTMLAACNPLPFLVELQQGTALHNVPRVELVRHVAARVDDWRSHSVVVASSRAEDGRLPAVPGEASWSVVGAVYVKYFLQIGETKVPLVLRTHSWDTEGADVKGPAFELTPRP